MIVVLSSGSTYHDPSGVSPYWLRQRTTLSKVVQRWCKLVVQCCCKVAAFSIARHTAKVVQRCRKLVVQLRVQIDKSRVLSGWSPVRLEVWFEDLHHCIRVDTDSRILDFNYNTAAIFSADNGNLATLGELDRIVNYIAICSPEIYRVCDYLYAR